MMLHTYILITLEAKAKGLLQVRDQPGLHRAFELYSKTLP